MTLEHYQTAFEPLLYGVALAIVLTLLLKETGPAALASPRPGGSTRGDMTREPELENTNSCWRAASGLDPVPTAVAHPCEAIGAGRRHRSRREWA